MNRVFRVLWSKARAQAVVASECQKTQAKKAGGCDQRPRHRNGGGMPRVFSLQPLAACIAIALGSSVLPAAATNITATAQGPTTVTQTNNKWTVTTNKVVNGTGVNRFDHFELSSGHIANLELGANTDRLVNFVKEQISVDGTVNAVKDNQVKGDLYFVSPKGMVVGEKGVINAGKIAAVVPTQDAYDKWTKDVDAALKDNLVGKLEEAEVPINPNGVITVKGSINAGNRVLLAASRVEVKTGAKVSSTIKNFGDLVNIKGVNGTITTDAGISQKDAQFVQDPNSGDVILLARTDTANQQWAASMVTPITVQSSVTVEKNATVHARRDAKLLADAGSGDYLEGSRTDGRGTTYQGIKDGLLVDARSSVTIGGSVQADRDVEAKAYTWSRIYDTGLQNVAKDWALEKLAGLKVPVAVDAAYYKGVSKAEVNLQESGQIRSLGSTKLAADSTAIVSAGTSTSLSDLANKDVGSLMPAASVLVAEVDSSASVQVDGDISSEGDVALTSKNISRSQNSATSGGQTAEGTGVAVLVADIKGSSSVKVGKASKISMTGISQGANPRKNTLTVSATQENIIKNAAAVTQGTLGSGGAAFNLTRVRTAADAQFLGTLDGQATDINIGSLNKTETYKVTANSSAGHHALGQAYQQAKTKIIDAAVNSLFFEFMSEAGKLKGVGASDWKLGAALSISDFSQTSNTIVAPQGPLHAWGNIAVTSESVRNGALLQAIANQKVGGGTPGTEKGTGSLAVLIEHAGSPEANTVSSLLSIADQAQLVASGGTLTISSQAKNEWGRLQALKRELDLARETLRKQFAQYLPNQWEAMSQRFDEIDAMFAASTTGEDFAKNMAAFGHAVAGLANGVASLYDVIRLTKDTPDLAIAVANASLDFANPALYLNAYASAGGSMQSASGDSLAAAGSVAIVSERVSNTLNIGKNTRLHAGTDLTVNGSTKNDFVGAAGLMDSIAGMPMPNISNAQAVGATLLVSHLTDRNAVFVREGAELKSSKGSVLLRAQDQTHLVNAAVGAGANSGSLSLSGMTAIGVLDGQNVLSVDDETDIQAAGKVELSAVRDDDVTSAAGSVIAAFGQKGGAAAGAGVAVNTGSLSNVVQVADNDTEQNGSNLYADAGGSITSGGDVTIQATTKQAINTVGAAGTVSTSASMPSVSSVPGLSGAIESVSGGFGKAGGVLSGLAVGPLTNLGGTMANSFKGLSDVLSSFTGNAAAQNGSHLTQQSAGALAGAGTGPATTGSSQAPSATINAAGAGSAAWNNLDLTNKTVLSSAGFVVNAGQGVGVLADTEKWVGAFAGAAALNFQTRGWNLPGSGSQSTVGIGGALAGNTGRHATAVEVKGIHFANQTRKVDIKALTDGTTVAEGLGLAVSSSAGNNLSLDAAASVNSLSSSTRADASDNKFIINAGDSSWQQTAWSGEDQITGGTGLGLSIGTASSSWSAAAGFTAAIANLSNEVASSFDRNWFQGVGQVDSFALTSARQITTAVTGQAAAGAQSTASLSGAVANANIENKISSTASQSNVALVPDGSLHLLAQGADKTTAQSLSDVVIEKENFSPGRTLESDPLLSGMTFAKGEKGKDSVTWNNLVDETPTLQATVAVVLGGSTNGSGGGAGITINNVKNSFVSGSSDLTVSGAKEITHQAKANAVTVAVASGVQAAKGAFSAAGSLVVGNVLQDASSAANRLQAEANQVVLAAQSKGVTAAVAGNAGLNLGSGSGATGVGAAVAIQNTSSHARTADANINVTGRGEKSGFSSQTKNEADIWVAAINGTAAPSASLAGSVAVNRSDRNTTVDSNNARFSKVASLVFSALDSSSLNTLSGAVGGAFRQGGGAATGAISYSGDTGRTMSRVAGVGLTQSPNASVTVEADAQEKLLTIAAAAAAGKSVGFAGAAATNEAKRTVTADFAGSEIDPSQALSLLSVVAQNRLSAADYAGYIGAAGTAALGLHSSVNRLHADVSARVSGAKFSTNLMRVKSLYAAQADSIAAGAALGANVAGAGSSAVTLIKGSSNALLEDVKATITGAGAVQALTHSDVDSMVGEAAVSGNVALGAASSVIENRVDTLAKTQGVELVENATAPQSTLAGIGSIDNNLIRNGVPNFSATALSQSLREKQNSGLEIASASTADYRVVLGNAAAAGNGAGAVVSNVLLHAGSTAAQVEKSSLKAHDEIAVSAQEAANVDAVLAALGAAGAGSAGAAVSVITTDHKISSDVSGAGGNAPAVLSSQNGDVSVQATAQEGIALQAAAAAAAGTGAAVGVASSVRQLTDVSSRVASTRVESNAKGNVSVLAHYDGNAQVGAYGITAAGGGSGAAAIDTKESDSTVETLLSDSSVTGPSASQTIDAQRNLNWATRAGTGAVGPLAAAAALVSVQNVKGKTSAQLLKTTIGNQDSKPNSLAIGAHNTDRLGLTVGGAAGSFAALGASVIVNKLQGSVQAIADGSTVFASDMSLKASQDRFVDQIAAFGTGGSLAGSASVLATYVGTSGNPFVDQSVTEGGLGISNLTQAQDGYAQAEKVLIGTKAVEDASSSGLITAEEKQSLAGAAVASMTASEGKTVSVLKNTKVDTAQLVVSALEDAAKGAGVRMTAGAGTLAAGALGAGVTVLRLNRGSNVLLDKALISSPGSVRLAAQAAGNNDLSAYQGTVALVAAQAAYSDAEIAGATNVQVNGSQIVSGNLQATARDDSQTALHAVGITAAAASGGGMVADLRDLSSVSITGNDLKSWGPATLEALRAQRLSAQSTAGYGGALNGIGALAWVTDLGNVRAALDNSLVSGNLALKAISDTGLFAHSYGAGASGLSVGVVKTKAETGGTVEASLKNSGIHGDSAQVIARVGGEDSEDKREISSLAEAYGGSVAMNFNHNKADAIEGTKVSTVVEANQNKFLSDTALAIRSDLNSLINAKATTGAGSAIYAGANWTRAINQGTATSSVNGTGSLHSLEQTALNRSQIQSHSTSAGGGVLVAEGNKAALAEAVDHSSVQSNLAGNWQANGDIAISATESSFVKVKSDNTKGGAVAGTGAKASVVTKGSSVVSVADSAVVSGQNVHLAANTNYDLGSADGDYAVDAKAYGAGAGARVELTDDMDRSTRVEIGKAIVSAKNNLSADAFTKGVNSLQVRSLTAGAIAGVTGSSEHNVVTANRVLVKSGAQLSTADWNSHLRLSAAADEKLTLNTLALVQGAAVSGAGADAKLNLARTNEVNFASGAQASSMGFLDIWSGRGADGVKSQFDLQLLASSAAQSAIGGAWANLQSQMGFANSAVIAGTGSAGRDVSVYADMGDAKTSQESRTYYWTMIGNNSDREVSSTILGTLAKNMIEKSSISLEGSLTAGVNNKAIIDLEGVVNRPDTGVSVPGSKTEASVKVDAGTKTEADRIASQIVYGTENTGNAYWQRHQQIQQQLALMKNQAGSTAYIALVAEDKALLQMMLDQGLAQTINGQIVPLQNKKTVTVKVDGVTTSGGNIALQTDGFSGKGQVKANAAQGVTIKNRTNADLVLGDVQILGKGGNVEFNGQAADSARLQSAGFAGSMSAQTGAVDPQLIIDSRFDGAVSNDVAAKLSFTPGVRVVGKVRNDAGSISVRAEGDIFAAASGSISSAGNLTLVSDTSSITQSYREGITNIGEGIETQYHDAIEEALGSQGVGNAAQNGIVSTAGSAAGSWVAAGDIFIAGEYINVNGTIQSGYSSYRLDLNENEFAETVSRIKSAWQQAGSPQKISVRSDAYLVSDGSAVKGEDGVYTKKIRAWYDPVQNRLILDDVDPKGGHVTLAGGIASTGGGRIIAADGKADISVNAGNIAVEVGNISTGNRSGRVTITDTNFAGDMNNPFIAARVTEMTSSGRTSYYLGKEGQRLGEAINTESAGTYTPWLGLNYVIERGWQQTTKSQTVDQIWGIFWGIPTGASHQEGSQTETVRNGAYSSQGKFVKGWPTDKNFTSSFTRNTQEGQWETVTSTSCGFLCFNYTQTIEANKTDKTDIFGRLIVKADQAIGVKFVSGKNSVNITSGQDVLLAGRVAAEQGSVKLESKEGRIAGLNTVAGIDAEQVELRAKAGIGLADNALKVSSKSNVHAAIHSQGDAFLDVTGLGSNRAIFDALQTVGRHADIKATGAVEVNDADVGSLAIETSAGDVGVRNLVLSSSGADSGSVRVQAAGNVWVRATEGDLLIDSVKANGWVELESVKGNLLTVKEKNANGGVSLEDRLAVWKQAGLLGLNGENLGSMLQSADIAQEESLIRADFARMQTYEAAQKAGKKLTDSQGADLAALKNRFGTFSSAQAVIDSEKQKSGTTLYALSHARYGWSAKDVTWAVDGSLVNGKLEPDSSKKARIEGSSIVLKAGGQIGRVAEFVTNEITNETAQGQALLRQLAQVRSASISATDDGSLIVKMYTPVYVKSAAAGKVTTKAGGETVVEEVAF